MKKTEIATRVKRGDPGFAPLMPVVHRLIEKGGRFMESHKTIDRAFSSTPNGYLCTIVSETLTLEDILGEFDFPEYFKIGVPVEGCVWDTRNNTSLCITKP